MSNINDQYTRKNIRSTILKRVIIRIDISGVINFDEFIQKLKKAEFMHQSFKRMRYLSDTRDSRPLKRIIPRNGTLPLSSTIQGEGYHFFDCSIDACSDTHLFVTPDCISLSIKCNEAYGGSEKYTRFMLEIVGLLAESESYINIERVGIRKIDSVDVRNLQYAREIFDKKFVVIKDFDSCDGIKESTKTSIYLNGEIHFNVVQHLSQKQSGLYNLVFDVDSYINDDEAVEHYIMNRDEWFNLLYGEMQDKMFEYFKDVVTVDYLEKCKVQE